jgi:hypothetical protein
MPRTRQICLGNHKRTRTQHNPTVRNIQVDKTLVRNCSSLHSNC